MTWHTATWVVWAVLGGAAAVLAVLSVTRRGAVRGPFGPLRAYLADHRLARVAAVMAWMWAGWHFFAR